jgi:hypothetical protein
VNYTSQGIVEKAVENDSEELIMYLLERGFITDPNFTYTPGGDENGDDEEEDEEDDDDVGEIEMDGDGVINEEDNEDDDDDMIRQ